MNTCDTCKHWSTKTVGQEDDVSYDRYAPTRRCAFLNDHNFDAMDGTVLPMCLGYLGMVDLTTGPKFGCIHHQPPSPSFPPPPLNH